MAGTEKIKTEIMQSGGSFVVKYSMIFLLFLEKSQHYNTNSPGTLHYFVRDHPGPVPDTPEDGVGTFPEFCSFQSDFPNL